MPLSKPLKKCIILLSVVIIVIIIWQAYNYKQKKAVNSRLLKKENFYAIDTALKFLQHGDIVFRRGGDGISDMFCNLNQTNKDYSHCGIALVDNKSIFIYHSIGGEDNPNQKIKKETWQQFVHPNANLSFAIVRYPFTAIEKQNLTSIVKNWHFKQFTFDMDFKLDNDSSKLYCVEFVYKAIQIATKNKNYNSTSKIKEFEYVAPDNILLHKNAKMVYSFKYH